ncbi:hypothetical protein CLU91_2838 [Janthinobacterium sp. 64]|nr:hypothetical protein CLU91_2838 [Janthinobacterium sp. 64]
MNWHDTDKNLKTGRWRDCCRQRAHRSKMWPTKSVWARRRWSAGVVRHCPSQAASESGRGRRASMPCWAQQRWTRQQERLVPRQRSLSTRAGGIPRCQNGCRSDRFGKLGGVDWSMNWHDMDKNLKRGRWRDCCRQRAHRSKMWPTKSVWARRRWSAGVVRHCPSQAASESGRGRRASMPC